MSFDVNKASAWIGIAVLAISTVITFTQLFGRVENLEKWKTELETANEKREAAQKKRDEALENEQKTRDEEQRKRDEALKESLGKISDSVNFANWNIGAINKQLEKKR